MLRRVEMKREGDVHVGEEVEVEVGRGEVMVEVRVE